MKNTRDAGGLAQLISSHERMSLGHFPTALEPLKRLGKWLGGPSVWVKRDDASGMGQGGNKVRALEFVLPEALAAGTDILLTSGVVQSNSVRQVAAAAETTAIPKIESITYDLPPSASPLWTCRAPQQRGRCRSRLRFSFRGRYCVLSHRSRSYAVGG